MKEVAINYFTTSVYHYNGLKTGVARLASPARLMET
jgi:hypothetical protein